MRIPIAAALLFLPLAARADPVQVNYSAYAAGLDVLDMSASFDVTPTQYQARVDYHTVGALGFVLRSNQNTTVSGRFDQGRPMPSRFYSAGTLRGQTRVTQIDYQNGQPTIRQLIPPNAEEREEVPADRRAGTIDTISAMADLIRQVNQTGRCEGHVLTFDGRRLTELSAHTVGQEILPPYSRSAFAGQALHCQFEGKMLAGFKLDEDRADQARQQRGDAWFAPITPGGQKLPVQISFHTPWFGEATMYLTNRQ